MKSGERWQERGKPNKCYHLSSFLQSYSLTAPGGDHQMTREKQEKGNAEVGLKSKWRRMSAAFPCVSTFEAP